LRYLADKHSAHRHTDRHTPMTTRPCGLRRAGKYYLSETVSSSKNEPFRAPIGEIVELELPEPSEHNDRMQFNYFII